MAVPTANMKEVAGGQQVLNRLIADDAIDCFENGIDDSHLCQSYTYFVDLRIWQFYQPYQTNIV